MPAFTLEYSEEALSQLKNMDRSIIKRIIKKIESTRSNSLIFFKRLTGRPEFKLRVGNYRIIAHIKQEERTIFIRAIGHRKDVYEKL